MNPYDPNIKAALANYDDLDRLLGRSICYVAGPYAAPDYAGIVRNVSRAVALGQLCTAQGMSPIVPHALGFVGTYGAFDESDGKSRDIALSCGVTLAAMVGQQGGVLVVIERDDRSLSHGTGLEHAAFKQAGGVKVLRYTWAQWRKAFENVGMQSVYDTFSVPNRGVDVLTDKVIVRPCTVCAQSTPWACSDCQIDGRGAVHVCTSTACRDAHEVLCPVFQEL